MAGLLQDGLGVVALTAITISAERLVANARPVA